MKWCFFVDVYSNFSEFYLLKICEKQDCLSTLYVLINFLCYIRRHHYVETILNNNMPNILPCRPG